MKKVGIVSCYFKNNYGSMLQSYATKKVLDQNQIENETINVDQNIDFKKGKRKYYLTQITNVGFIKSKFGMIKLKIDKKLMKELGKNIAIRNRKFNEFRQEFNLSKACKNYQALAKVAQKDYSNIMVGSDQLWLPVNIVADYYTLNWVPQSINTISYATSFGVSSIPEKYKEQYTCFLKKINHLSVRENSGVKLIKDIAGLDAKLVCDPTILLTKEEWDCVAVKERIIPEKYIFCYFLGSNIEHRKFVERLKEKTGYKIVSINHSDEYVKYSDEFADMIPYDIGPKEWIDLVRNAEYVCTDSFHGTVFSILYNKVFFDFRRYQTNSKMSTNSRIDSLLNVAGISTERILTGKENVEDVLQYKIDYDIVNKKMETFRNDSITWLLDAIEIPEEKHKGNHIEITNKEQCSGCTSCYASCPKDAIEMTEDHEGFLYPVVNQDKCIDCGICKKRCPILYPEKLGTFDQKAYLFQNKKENVRKDSTSGGFFTAIGEYVISNGGAVYGASFNSNFVVEHTVALTKEELAKFRKSKYVQSNQGDCFREIKERLEQHQLVCYSGTPCQVAGLKKFLDKEYKELILIDIMCHSVPSPFVFEKYKKYVLKKKNANHIRQINFRDKSKYGYKYSMMRVETDQGVYAQGIDTDPYLRAFFGDYSVRPACYHCQFKTQRRVSDITIWDCFNVNELEKSFDDDKGTTRLLIQSSKGLDIINQLHDVKVKEMPVEIAIKNVKEMLHSVSYNEKRDAFFQEMHKGEQAFDTFFPITYKTNVNSFVRKTLSVTGLYSGTKSLAKKVLRK